MPIPSREQRDLLSERSRSTDTYGNKERGAVNTPGFGTATAGGGLPASGFPQVEEPVSLDIPSLGITDATIAKAEGDGFEQLGWGCVSWNGGSPGFGCLSLSAHADGDVKELRLFERLHTLPRGAQVIVHTDSREFVYEVDRLLIVPPEYVSMQTLEPSVMLTTCWPPGVDNKRIVVFAHLKEKNVRAVDEG